MDLIKIDVTNILLHMEIYSLGFKYYYSILSSILETKSHTLEIVRPGEVCPAVLSVLVAVVVVVVVVQEAAVREVVGGGRRRERGGAR